LLDTSFGTGGDTNGDGVVEPGVTVTPVTGTPEAVIVDTADNILVGGGDDFP